MPGKISAIIPVYNTPLVPFEECIESLLNQEYSNFEIILVDDGSDKETADVCDDFVKRDCRIKVVHQKNGGPSKARNAGISIVTGDYLTFVDSDDLLKKNTWKDVIEAFEIDEPDVVVFGWTEYSDKKKIYCQVTNLLDGEVIDSEKELFYISGDNYLGGGGYPWNKVWNIEFLKSTNNGSIPIFDESLITYEDKEWIIRALCYANKVKFLCELYYEYRYFSSSLTHDDEKIFKRQMNSYDAYDKILAILKNKNKAAYKRALNFYYKFAYEEVVKSGMNPQYKKRYKKLCKSINPLNLNTLKKVLFWIYVMLRW